MTGLPLLPRSLFTRSAPALVAATLLAAIGLGPSVSAAAQAEYAGPSTTPLSASNPARKTAPAAAIDHGGPRWTELTTSQRKVLAPLANDWNDGIDSRGKERWMDVADRFHRMPADEQQRANQRMVEWSHMTVAERMRARVNFQESRNVSKEEREARWKAYQALPDEKKRELAKRAAAAAAPASAASVGVAAAHRRLPPSVNSVQPKSNVVAPVVAGHAASGPVPVVVPARPGTTAPLMTRRAAPPAHQRDGQPKIDAGPNAVDRTTLLPRHAPPPTVSAAASTTTPPRP